MKLGIQHYDAVVIERSCSTNVTMVFVIVKKNVDIIA